MTNPAFSSQKQIQKLDEGIIKSKKSFFTVKRYVDTFIALLALLALLPLMLIIALLVFLEDPHTNPIFRQKRCGKDGKFFNIYKFRTMVSNAEDLLEEVMDLNESDGPVFKIKDDPRITKIGKILRKTGLDELPQLVNIIKGDMNIIGPRPPLPKEVLKYNDLQKQRLLIMPGLSCYWQIQPHRNDISFDDWVILDLKYIEDCGFLTDLKIIAKTIITIFKGEGR